MGLLALELGNGNAGRAAYPCKAKSMVSITAHGIQRHRPLRFSERLLSVGLLLFILLLFYLGRQTIPRIISVFGREAFASPDTGQVVIHPDLIHRLEMLYDRVGGQLRITGAYRTPERNQAVGGASKSFHLTGQAADVAPAGALSWQELYDAARAAGFGGVIWEKSPQDRAGWGPHIHLDVGPRIYHQVV